MFIAEIIMQQHYYRGLNTVNAHWIGVLMGDFFFNRPINFKSISIKSI